MTIAVNCWILRNKKLDGIGYFTVNAIAHLIKDHPEVHFQILCDKKFTETYFDFPNSSKHKLFPALRHPLLYVIYMELVLPIFLRKLMLLEGGRRLIAISKSRAFPFHSDVGELVKPDRDPI